MENMDIGRSFTFMFEDQNWVVKILIGGVAVLLAFLLIPIPIILGYQLAVIRNTANGADLPLPEWDDFGSYFSEGLQLIIGGLIYYAPVLLFMCLLFIVSGATADQGGDVEGAAALLITCINCLVSIYSLVVGLIFPAAMLRFAATRRLGAMFQFGEVFGFIRRNAGNYIIAVLLGWVAGLIAAVVGLLTCFIGVPWTSWWSNLVTGHLLGQVWRASRGPVAETVYTPEIGGGEALA